MAEYTYEIATDIGIPNITIKRCYIDGVLSAYHLTSNDGYVMYDTTANHTEILEDENGLPVYDDNGEFIEISVIYYYRFAAISARYDPSTWQNDWVAVLESSVDENYIFGVVDTNKPEVM